MSTVYRASRWSLVIVGVLLLMAGAALLWIRTAGEPWLERKVREQVLTLVEETSIPGHTLRMDSIDVDLASGGLTMADVRLDIDPRLEQDMDRGAMDHLFTASAAGIRIRGLSFLRIFLFRELHMDAFELSGLRFTYWVGGSRQADDEVPAMERSTGSFGLVSVLMADTILIEDAIARVEDVSDALPDLDVAGLSISATGLCVQRGAMRSGVQLAVHDARLLVDSVHARLSDSGRLAVGAVALQVGTGSCTVRDVRCSTTPGPDRAEDLSFAADSLVLRGLDVHSLFADDGLFLSDLALHGLRIEAQLDKALGIQPGVRRPLPPEALLAWEFPLAIDTLRIHRGVVRYRERSDRTGRWGDVPLDDVHMQVNGLSNRGGAPPMVARCTGRLFDSANVALDYQALLDGSGAFHAEVVLGRMPLMQLNQAIGPLARMEVRSGSLHSLHMRLDGDDRRARGRVRMAYAGLLMGPEPGTPPAIAHQQLSGILAHLTEERHGGGLAGDRTRQVRVERDTTKALPHYLWQGLRKGLFRDVGADAWQRMRQVVRTGRQRR
jgi:hypothetical protein